MFKFLKNIIGEAKKPLPSSQLKQHDKPIAVGAKESQSSNQIKKTDKIWYLHESKEFSITIICSSEVIAKEAKAALYDSSAYLRNGDLYCYLAELIAVHRIECIQINQLFDEYADKYRQTYSELKLKYPIDSFNSISDIQSRVTTRLKIPCSCAQLFDFNASNSWIFKDDIISKYDPQALRFYIKRYNKYGKLWKVEKSGSFAKIAIRCCKTGLARKARDIPIDVFIRDLPVKLLSNALGKKHTHRKNAAEEMLLEKSPYDLLDKICDLETYYEFYVPIDESLLLALNNAWKWAEAVASILQNAVGASMGLTDDHWIKLLSKKPEKGLSSISLKQDINVINNEKIEIIQSALDFGGPISEFHWVSPIIIYLYFSGMVYEKDSVIEVLCQEIAAGGFDKAVIAKIMEMMNKPIVINMTNESLGFKESDSKLEFIPYYLLQKKVGHLTCEFIDKAMQWEKIHPFLFDYQRHNDGYHMFSAWQEHELPPHETDEWQDFFEVQKYSFEKTERELKKIERRHKDPIYGGRPQEVLTPPRSEWHESFTHWSYQLVALLSTKNRATEFQDSKQYEEVALEVGDRCMKLLPSTKKNLAPIGISSDNDISEIYKYNDWAFNTNQGLVKYVELLIKIGNLTHALYVCDECIKYGVNDGTETGFRGRVNRIKNKISKDESKSLNARGRKGALSDEQILEVVNKYLSSSSKDRQLLPIEYGITRSNLYYLVSKNKHSRN